MISEVTHDNYWGPTHTECQLITETPTRGKYFGIFLPDSRGKVWEKIDFSSLILGFLSSILGFLSITLGFLFSTLGLLSSTLGEMFLDFCQNIYPWHQQTCWPPPTWCRHHQIYLLIFWVLLGSCFHLAPSMCGPLNFKKWRNQVSGKLFKSRPSR